MTLPKYLPQRQTSTMVVKDEAVSNTTGNFSALHPDIIDAHILTRLDGPSLATASCSSATLRHLSSRQQLWTHVCHSTWPSTTAPRVSRLISTFPDGGPRAFFAQSFPLPLSEPVGPDTCASSSDSPSELISAVDVHYRDELIFSKVQETETVTGWFRCSPFRIDLLEPKDVIPTSIRHPEGEDTCSNLMEDIVLSWIVIDPVSHRAVNLSSHKPVSVQRHWLTGEVQVRFASILPAQNQKKGPIRTAKGDVQCAIMMTCGKSEGGDMQVKEVCMEMENMDGMHLNGKDSLVILDRALKGKRGKSMNKEEEGRRRYEEYVEMKKERKERKLRTEGALDVFCVAFGVLVFLGFWGFVWYR
ncbi:OLC1v1034139C1 [Oldenlandia corymbosa var. corymbosa]|uniref:OLC1v1034139C1 n=1 Tax=Oldenlandia corymbosa var. corymbosa TaxID=529605 RepID=A0AAV1CQP9_OLDCO|nr:OLC1v1034139C1 [Oldenlandia corymbosa var. corymbosa]